MNIIGQITELKRYPIKSFAGEVLLKAELAAYGFVGDRKYAFIDESKQDFARYFTARQIPQMLQYQAEWVAGADNKSPKVQVTSPQGAIFDWNEQLLTEIQQFTTSQMSQLICEPEGSELMAVDCESVLLITDASLRELEQLWGKPLDQRRFRSNIKVALIEDTPFIEAEWVGRKLRIGDVELQINVECERCSMVTLDPDYIVKDGTLLEKIIKVNKQNFGVYASIIKPGMIRQGDAIYLI
ncbi:MOSC domain-containing protein [Paenibacillus psychroresistens]|nr:MOSC N-terminal beta barrel domain-containing protein [Paenibacillus psychroresistens]